MSLAALVALLSIVALFPASAAVADDDVAGRIFTVAGPGVAGPNTDRLATEAGLRQVTRVAPLSDGGFLLVESDFFDWSIRRVTAAGKIGTIMRGTTDLAPPHVMPFFPGHLEPLPDGGFLIAAGQTVLAATPDGTTRVIAGTGKSGSTGDGGPATEATFMSIASIAVARDGAVLIADAAAHRIRRIGAEGTISTVAGTGVQGFSGDGGPATRAQLSEPFDVAETDSGGFLFVDGRRIRRVDGAGTITTVAGPAAPSMNLVGFDALRNGGFVTADDNGFVRRFSTDGRLLRRYGNADWPIPTGGVPDAMVVGDGGRASKALIDLPNDVAQTSDGGLLIGESRGRVRYIAPRHPLLLAVAAQWDRARARPHSYHASYRTTRPASVAWTLRRRGAVVARGVRRPGGRLRHIRLKRSFRPGAYVLELSAHQGTQRATSRQSVFLSGRLTPRWAMAVAHYAAPESYGEPDEGGETFEDAGCRRFGARRTDCRWTAAPTSDEPRAPTRSLVVSIMLARNGQILIRYYTTSRHGRPGGFRKHPRKASPAEIVPLQCVRRGYC